MLETEIIPKKILGEGVTSLNLKNVPERNVEVTVLSMKEEENVHQGQDQNLQETYDDTREDLEVLNGLEDQEHQIVQKIDLQLQKDQLTAQKDTRQK